MNNIKQIREQFDLITEKEEKEDRKLSALVRAGLYDAHKLPALKKALEKSADKMTAQEKRMLINLLDSLISQVISDEQVYRKVKQNVHNMAEAKEQMDTYSKFDPRFKPGYPSDKQMPSVVILKRKAIRVYPDNQKVALYYAQALDKYVTIPFNDVQTSLNEAKKDDDDKKKRPSKIKIAGRRVEMRRKAADAAHLVGKTGEYKNVVKRVSGLKSRGSNAGTILGTLIHDKIRKAVISSKLKNKKKSASTSEPSFAKPKTTTPAPVPAAAKPETKTKSPAPVAATPKVKSTKTTSAPTTAPLKKRSPEATKKKILANPKVQVSSGAMKHAGLAEEYRLKVQQIREARQYGTADAALDAASFIPGPVGSAASLASAGMSLSRGDYTGAALDAAGALPVVGYAAKAAKLAKAARAAKAGIKASKGLSKGSKLARSMVAARKGARGVGKAAKVAGLAASALGSGGGSASSGSPDSPQRTYNMGQSNLQGKSSFADRAQSDSAQRKRDERLNRQSQQAMVKESNVLDTIKTIVENNIPEQTIEFNENKITINNTVAKKLLNVYESINKTNKKKMEQMLNEDATSFNKVLMFAVRQ